VLLITLIQYCDTISQLPAHFPLLQDHDTTRRLYCFTSLATSKSALRNLKDVMADFFQYGYLGLLDRAEEYFVIRYCFD